MANEPLNPPTPRASILGSKRRDRLLGIGLAIAWWVVGSVLLLAFVRQAQGICLVILSAYIWQLVHLGRKPGGGTLVVTLVVAPAVVPVVAILGFFGMCSVGIIKGRF